MHQVTSSQHTPRLTLAKAAKGPCWDEKLLPVASYVEQTLNRLDAVSANLLPAVGLIAIHEEQRNGIYWTIQRAKAAYRIDPPALLQVAEEMFNHIEKVSYNRISASELSIYMRDHGGKAKEALKPITMTAGR
jgi:hypothetical protein